MTEMSTETQNLCERTFPWRIESKHNILLQTSGSLLFTKNRRKEPKPMPSFTPDDTNTHRNAVSTYYPEAEV